MYIYFYVHTHTHTPHEHHSMTLYVALSQFFTCCIVFQCQGLFIYLAGTASNVKELWEKETGGPKTESAGVLELPSEAPAEAPGHKQREMQGKHFHIGNAACRECITVYRGNTCDGSVSGCVTARSVWTREHKGIREGVNMRVCLEVLAGNTWWREMTELILGCIGKTRNGETKNAD